MALEELDELLATFAEADRPAAREMLTRNPNASSRLKTQETVYKAFVDGDPVALATAAAAAGTPPAVVQPPPASTPALGIDLAALDARLDGFRKNMFESPEFTTAVETRAKAIADAQIAAVTPNLIGRGAKIADTIATIRESHIKEFGEPLDSAKFEEFYAKDGAMYGNDLVKSHAAFVMQKRTDKQIADGIAAGLAARATNDVPGTSLPASDSPLSGFIDYNVKKNGGTAPSANADDAAKAFAAMRGGWTN